ncbi:DUF3684 domain-containing protein [Roseobacter sinensis]|uniref:DUF3684 domain-containing protein n=1 Tax=Roseobacter sinensis TaxID=2931391 RepID=A0ABT3BEF6_9RHOB|nr:DUF3684 domain-containing protein [Roseobacter sp. WL0113]MCV3271953.1 DUF3684 domain-containing protein [Roseobacter sp. WL0113]
MTFKKIHVTDIPGFARVRLTFCLPRDAIDHDLMETMRDHGEDEESVALAAALPALTRWLGHHHRAALFAPLLESILEEERVFGAEAIDQDNAVELRAAFEAELLARCSPVAA